MRLNDSKSCQRILPLKRLFLCWVTSVIPSTINFGYTKHNKGATSGSRIRFKNEETGQYIDIHRPHPGSIMKAWMMKAIYQHLNNNGLI